MKILFTGASSFSGYWFARTLAALGCGVTGTFRSALKDYSDVRAERVRLLADNIHCESGVSVGDSRFIQLVGKGDFDVLCLHAAEIANYRSVDFDSLSAAQSNTREIRRILTAFQERGGGTVIDTGSVFEPYEGVGGENLRAFSPYGLSKHFTHEIIKWEARRLGLKLGKFVIPNPFGPYEEPRFTTYMCREWAAGRMPRVNTPLYVRDNIPITLLASAYGCFLQRTASANVAYQKLNPSGFVESQGAFAMRYANEVGKRLGQDLRVELGAQTEFSEPRMRVNMDPADEYVGHWSEPVFWEEQARYAEQVFWGAHRT